MASTNRVLRLWKRLSTKPGGKWAFSRMLCFQAPYFSSISPRFEELRPNYCRVHVRKRRAVLNHIGTVHAIAMCNMAELAGGSMTEISLPASYRWIPKGMWVEYLNKATTDVSAIATPETPLEDIAEASEQHVNVEVTDSAGQAVFRAGITMWISPKKTAGSSTAAA